MLDSMIRGATALLAVTLVAGCASAGTDPSTSGPAGAEASYDDRFVVVENNSFDTVRVYAVRGSIRMRLGTITSMETARFELKPTAFSEGRRLQLMVHPIASSSRHLTEMFAVRPGESVELRVHNHLPLTNYSVLAFSGN